MAQINKEIYRSEIVVADNDTTNDLDIPLPALGVDEGRSVLVNILNGCDAEVKVDFGNVEIFETEEVFVPFEEDVTIAAEAAIGKKVGVFPLGRKGRLVFTKAAGAGSGGTHRVIIRQA